MEQKLIYFEDQYLKELESVITEIDGNKVVLQENLFFPKTKGELSDFGTVNGIKVVNVEKVDGKVSVEIENIDDLKVGDKVLQKINWDYRLNSMKLHSALHLVAGVMECDNGIRAVAGNVYEDKAILRFKKPVPDMFYIALEDSANELIRENKGIKTYWDEKRKGFRWCRVSDLEPIPCGGMHVKNTGEIGELMFDGNGEKLEVRLRG